MNATLKSITPALAAEMLKKNTRNRPLNTLHVKRLANEMKTGRWKVNGDAIRFNGDIMIDGQHRCAASVMSNCTFETLVIDGLSADVFTTIDAGRRRDGGDTLSLIGVPNSNKVAAAIKVVHLVSTGAGRHIGHVYFANSEIEDLLSEYDGIVESVQLVSKIRSGFAPASVFGALHYLFAKRDEDAADDYIEDLRTGENLVQGDGVYLLRERLMQNAYMKQQLRMTYICALGIRAWNYRRLGRTVGVLRWKDTDEFPMIAD